LPYDVGYVVKVVHLWKGDGWDKRVAIEKASHTGEDGMPIVEKGAPSRSTLSSIGTCIMAFHHSYGRL
jgi:hypothetical protein